MCQFLKEWGGPTILENIRANDNDMLQHFVAMGNLQTCQFLVQWCKLTADDARANHSEVFKLAAANNDVKMIKFLLTLKGAWSRNGQGSTLTLEDVRDNDNAAFIEAACSGSLDVCIFFKELGLTVNDARSRDNVALKLAAKNGHMSILKFLANWMTKTRDGTWDYLTSDDICDEGCRAYLLAEKHGHPEVCEFIKTWARLRRTG